MNHDRDLTPEEFIELRGLCHLDWLHRRRLAGLEFRASQCTGKHPFASWEAADASMSAKLRRLCAPYHCSSCGKWHIGSRETKRNRRLAQRERCSR